MRGLFSILQRNESSKRGESSGISGIKVLTVRTLLCVLTNFAT